MKKLLTLSIFLILITACSDRLRTENIAAESAALKVVDSNDAVSTSPIQYEDYKGTFLEDVFPLTAFERTKEEVESGNFIFELEGYRLTIKNNAPVNIERDGKDVFTFKLDKTVDYRISHVGISHLRGTDSREIYVLANTGVVCCTNYWILDVTTNKPTQIFHSEDWGWFRDAIEIFDADGDGIYELMQADAAFRYMLDQCGACSPEPRAYFKYDTKSKQYRPAKGLRQDFLMSFDDREKELADEFKSSKVDINGKLATDQQFYRNLDAYVVDVFYVGDEKRAWQIFDKYYGKDEKVTRAEIKHRLATSKFYQAMIKSQK